MGINNNKKNQNLVSKNKKISSCEFSLNNIYIYCLYIIWQSLHRFLLNTGSRNLSLNISQFELNNATDKDSCSFFQSIFNKKIKNKMFGESFFNL